MSIYSRARRHINMERVKELKEEKYIAGLKKQQEIVLAEISRLWKEKNKHYDWRTDKDLTETMTTAAMGLVNLPAEGDTNLEAALDSTDLNANSVSLGDNATITLRAYDITKYDTIKFTVTQLTSGTQGLKLFGNYGTSPGQFLIISNDLKANPVVTIPSSYLNRSNFKFQVRSFNEDPGNMATYRVSASFQRRTPVSVLVSLDDPDASSFIRDGVVDTLSPGEKKKKLEQQLKASNEYLYKMFGKGMPSGAIKIAEYEPQQSFEDLASETEKNFSDFASDARNPMGTGDQALDREMTALLASPLVQAAASQGIAALAALIGSFGTAAQIMRSINNTPAPPVDYGQEGVTPQGETSQQAQEREAAEKKLADAEAQYGADSEEAAEARRERSKTLTRHKRERRGGRSTTGDARKQKEAEQEAAKKAREERLRREQEARRRENEEKIRRHKEQEKKGRQRDTSDEIKDLLRGESYQPERKSFKDLTNKIPGYYDGKPAPLGFPIVEPPKMKNGMHPDLVDGKKVAKRFNRLDPISAKAMPPTGNPHIDKKVKAAAKKPK